MSQYFEHLLKTLPKETDLLGEIGEKALQNIKERHGHYPTDINWKPLKAQTVKYKATGDSPLLETGELKNSYNMKKGRDNVSVGSDQDKAIWMEYGTVTSTGGTPARPVSAPEKTKAEKEYIPSITDKHINKHLQ